MSTKNPLDLFGEFLLKHPELKDTEGVGSIYREGRWTVTVIVADEEHVRAWASALGVTMQALRPYTTPEHSVHPFVAKGVIGSIEVSVRAAVKFDLYVRSQLAA